jgi:hypothetical protein
MSYTLQAIAGTNTSVPDVSTGLTVVELSENLRMDPLSSDVRARYGIPLLPFDEGDPNELPSTLNDLCCALSDRGLIASLPPERRCEPTESTLPVSERFQ